MGWWAIFVGLLTETTVTELENLCNPTGMAACPHFGMSRGFMPLLHGVRNGTKAKSHDCGKDGSDSDFAVQKTNPKGESFKMRSVVRPVIIKTFVRAGFSATLWAEVLKCAIS